MDVVGATRDARSRGGGRVARSLEWAIQREGCVPLLAGLQGGDTAIRDLRGVTNVILQLHGYGWSSREHPRDPPIASDVGNV